MGESTSETTASPLRAIEPIQDGLDLLHHFESFLKRRIVLKGLRARKGFREIQRNRFELFVRARDKETEAFDWVCQELIDKKIVSSTLDEIRQSLIEYAISQARRDNRVKEHVFHNFSFIINYGKVTAQLPHIDLVAPNHQFGLIITNNSPGTWYYKAEQPIGTVEDLSRVWTDIPESIKQRMSKGRASELLKNFGDVLSPHIVVHGNTALYPTGTLLSLSGGIMHAGPASDTRVVLFFSGNPPGGLVPEYHPDTQYFAGLLLCDMVRSCWDDAEFADKAYLLRKLCDCIQSTKCYELHGHLGAGILRDFCLDVALSKKRTEPLIGEYASKKGLLEIGNSMKKVSVDGLGTDWNGQFFETQVFRLKDDSIIIYYPETKESEGFEENKHYTLQMKKRGLFDGTNGILRDDEGTQIDFTRGVNESATTTTTTTTVDCTP